MVDESWLLLMLLLAGNGELWQIELEAYLPVATPADFNLVLHFPETFPQFYPGSYSFTSTLGIWILLNLEAVMQRIQA
jgi:hypothetical protein